MTWGRKSLLTLIALLASIPMVFYLRWTGYETAAVWGLILGVHHAANVMDSTNSMKFGKPS